jgi:hypothetical protein
VLSEVDELDGGELEGGDGMFDFRVLRKSRIDDLNPFLYPTWEATPSG